MGVFPPAPKSADGLRSQNEMGAVDTEALAVWVALRGLTLRKFALRCDKSFFETAPMLCSPPFTLSRFLT